MRKSSLVASTDPLYASTGTLSHPVAIPLRRVLRQTRRHPVRRPLQAGSRGSGGHQLRGVGTWCQGTSPTHSAVVLTK